MQVDSEYLRRYYASLSDEALLAIDRGDLIETAQKCLDAEVRLRELDLPNDAEAGEPATPDAPEVDDDKPGWLEDAAEVYSDVVIPGRMGAPGAHGAREALKAAGIPCYLELCETPHEEDLFPEPTHRWRLMVPGKLNLRAASVLDRDIFNPDFEAEWKTHLETLSDQELRTMSPREVFCGLFDRIERVIGAWDEELARRRLSLPAR